MNVSLAFSAINMGMVEPGRLCNKGSLVNAVISGLINGAMQIPLCIALASVIFSGELKVYLPLGIGLFLMGNAMVSTIASFYSSSRYGLATIQDSTPAIIALMVISIESSVRQPSSTLPTIVTAIAISTFVLGITFASLGHFRLGIVARYFPQPVVSGYLAGTGIILVLAGLGFLTDIRLTMLNLDQLLHTEVFFRSLPGILFGVSLSVIHARFSNAWILPSALFASALSFSITISILHVSPEEAIQRGWLQGGFSSSRLWPPVEIGQLLSIDWAVLAQHSLHYAVIAFVGSLALLLNVSSLEQETGENLDLDKELRANGVANLVTAFLGGANGYLSISGSALSHELNAPGRTPSLVNAGMSVATISLGASVLQIFPNFLLGGLTIFLGISMLKEPLLDNYRRFSRSEFIATFMVALSIAYFGFVVGVVVGLVVSSIFFVVAASRINPVRVFATGASIQSRMVRSRTATALLRLRGRDILIVSLQASIFFGSAFNLYQKLNQILDSQVSSRPRYLLLDFKSVFFIDAAGIGWINRLAKLASSSGIILILTNLPSTARHDLTKVLEQRNDSENRRTNSIYFISDLDDALQWCEERVLSGNLQLSGTHGQLHEPVAESLELIDQEACGWASQFVDKASEYLLREERPVGSVLWRIGDPSEFFYLLLAGEAEVSSLSGSGEMKRYFTVGPGSFVGETSFFTRQTRLGTVTVSCDSVLYLISKENLDRMLKARPDLALELEQRILGIETLLVSESFHSTDFMLQ